MKASSLVGHVADLLQELDRSIRPADAVIGYFFRTRRYLGSHDRRFIAESYYGVLRHRRYAEHILQSAGNLPPEATSREHWLLILSAYLLAVYPTSGIRPDDFLDAFGPGQQAEHVTGILTYLGAHNPLDQSDLPPGIRYSFPDWLIAGITRAYREDILSGILESLNSPAPISIRVNTLKTTVEECIERLSREGVKARKGRLARNCLILEKRMNAFSLPSFRDGWFEVQDEGSQFLVEAAGPGPTDTVLDLCAGAGGKTLALAAWMKNRGEVVATDVSRYRLDELGKRLRRSGARNIRIRKEMPTASRGDIFDLVFVDAPCSGTGTIRRNPGIKWSLTEHAIAELTERQYHILIRAADYVREGGTLIYVTCSLLREENEDIVERFLADQKGFIPEPRSLGPGVLEGGADAEAGSFRLHPHVHGSDGFFCAFMRKTGQTA